MKSNVIISEESEVLDYLAALLLVYYFYATRPFAPDYKLSYQKLAEYYLENHKHSKPTTTISKSQFVDEPYITRAFNIFERRLGESGRFDVTCTEDAIAIVAYRKDGGVLTFIYPNVSKAITMHGAKGPLDLDLLYKSAEKAVGEKAKAKPSIFANEEPVRQVKPPPETKPKVVELKPALPIAPKPVVPVIKEEPLSEPVVEKEDKPTLMQLIEEKVQQTPVPESSIIEPSEELPFGKDDLMMQLLKGLHIKCFFDYGNISGKNCWIVVIYPETTVTMYRVHLLEKSIDRKRSQEAYNAILAMCESGTCHIGYGTPAEAMDNAMKSFEKEFYASYA